MVDIEAFKKKFESTLRRVDENLTPITKELDIEFSKLKNIQAEKKGSYQEQITQEEKSKSPNDYSRIK